MSLAFDTSQNSSFSTLVPGLQLAIDSTSLGEFKICPRRYFYTIICGYQPRNLSIDLKFGLAMHRGVECYHKTKASGANHEEALRTCVRNALTDTWDTRLSRPEVWEDSEKNRVGLVRSLVWFLNSPDEARVEPKRLANGKPAVELSFKFDSGYRTKAGEPVLLCGHLDMLRDFGGKTYIEDVKSTRHQLNPRYFDGFSPDNQFSLYVLAGRVVWHEEVEGIICAGIQVGASYTRVRREIIPRPAPVIDEWLEELGGWLASMERCALDGVWPANDKSCSIYGGCPFRQVCERSPLARQQVLDGLYTRRVWDPLIAR